MCRGRHRVENRVGEVQARGGGGAGPGGVVTYFADRMVPWYKFSSLAPRNSVSVCVCCLSVCGNHFYSCALCTHFTAKYSENVFCANICTKNVQTPMLTAQVVRRCVFMVRMLYVAVV